MLLHLFLYETDYGINGPAPTYQFVRNEGIGALFAQLKENPQLEKTIISYNGLNYLTNVTVDADADVDILLPGILDIKQAGVAVVKIYDITNGTIRNSGRRCVEL